MSVADVEANASAQRVVSLSVQRGPEERDVVE